MLTQHTQFSIMPLHKFCYVHNRLPGNQYKINDNTNTSRLCTPSCTRSMTVSSVKIQCEQRDGEGWKDGGDAHTHTPEEVSLLLSLFLCASQQVKLGPIRRVGKVEPPASQQLPHVLHQLHSGPDAERGKGCLCDAKHLNIFHLRGGGREGWKGGGRKGER